MNKFRKLISGMVTIASAVTFSTAGLVSTAYAVGQLTTVSATLSDTRSGQQSNYAMSMKAATNGTVKAVVINFRRQPSTSSTTPNGLDLTSVSTAGNISLVSSGAAGTVANWAPTVDTTNQNITYVLSGGIAMNAGETLTFTIPSVSNNTITGSNQCDSVSETDTCYLWITTYSDTGATTAIDSGVTSYTVTTEQVVTATVDPSLTFTIGAVSASSIATNDTNANCTISAGVMDAVDTTTTTFPLGNIRVGVPKCAQQSYTVVTNASTGYDIRFKFFNSGASTRMMYGSAGEGVSTNFIVPFSATGGGSLVTSPTAFTTGSLGSTPNVDSAMLGIRTINGGVNGFGSNAYVGPVVGSGTGTLVMSKSGPDNGGTPAFITLKVITNAYAVADKYTGKAFNYITAKF